VTAADDLGPGAAVAVEGVTVRLGGRTVLDDVSFAVRPGEVCGLIGANGAGKTTILRAILGLITPSAGRVLIDGRPRHRHSGAVGYVPQKVLIDADLPLRARDLVALGIDGHRPGLPLPSRRRRERVDELLAAVDASAFADSRVGELSGGELQRVLVAHALAHEPRLLLLDEPLANLDLRAEQEVVDLLGKVAREQGVAVLLSAHDVNPLLGIMSRVVYLAEGRAASGTTDEVVRADVLTRLYGRPITVLEVEGRLVVVTGSDVTVHEGGCGDEDQRRVSG
jgi:zinc/manganese transport system ATP-binding protein